MIKIIVDRRLALCTHCVSHLATTTTGFRPRSGVVTFNDNDNDIDNDSIVEGIVQMSKGDNASKVVADVKAGVAALNAVCPRA